MPDERDHPERHDDDKGEEEPRRDDRKKKEEPGRRGLIIAPTEGGSDVQPEP